MSATGIEENTELNEENSDESKNENGVDVTPDTLRILEALLFASDELLTAARIKAILPGNPDARQIRKMVDKINIQLQKERHPFEIVEIGGGYQFRTVAYFHPWVRQIFKEKAAKKLSLQALECLAVIAYRQPVSKSEIEAVRGVVSDGAMKTLLEKKLVTISGRSEKPGRPLQYATTNEFLKYFGLNKIEDLPRIEEFEAIAREKIEDLSFEELSNGAEGDNENTLEDQKNADDEESVGSDVENQETEHEKNDSDSKADNSLKTGEKHLETEEYETTNENRNSQQVIQTAKDNDIEYESNTIEPEATAVFEVNDLYSEDVSSADNIDEGKLTGDTSPEDLSEQSVDKIGSSEVFIDNDVVDHNRGIEDDNITKDHVSAQLPESDDEVLLEVIIPEDTPNKNENDDEKEE